MPALRCFVWLALALLLAAPAPLGAQSALPLLLAAEHVPDGVALTIACAQASPPGTLAVSLDGGPPVLVEAVAAPALPPALMLVLDVSPAMAGSATPHSTRLRDAVSRAAALLDRAPTGSLVGLVLFDSAARLAVPLAPDAGAVRNALATLAVAPASEPSTPAALSEALQLGAKHLQQADGSGALVVFAADGPALERPPVPLASDGRLSISIVGLGVGTPPNSAAPASDQLAGLATALGAAYLPYHTAQLSELPALRDALDRRYDELLAAPPVLRALVPATELAPGPHKLAVTGCGSADNIAIEVGPVARSASAPNGLLAASVLAALVAGGALMIRRRNTARYTGRAGKHGRTERYGTALDASTERRAAPRGPEARYWLVVWDGQQRRIYPLVARQNTIGRDQGCDIRIESPLVSGLHARLSLTHEQIELADLESTNGTYLGDLGRPLVAGLPEPIQLGDVIWIGPEVRLTIERAEPNVAAEA